MGNQTKLATKWEFELRDEQTLDGPACTATVVSLSAVRRGLRGRASLKGLECCDHWFQSLGAPLGSREGRGVGGRSFSVFPHPSPNPAVLGSPGCEAHSFKSAWESPGPPSPARAGDIKAAAAGSGCGRGGRALGRWLRWAPFHPGWEPTPREVALGFCESLQARGGRTWGCKAAQSCVTSACHGLSLGLGFSGCLPL